MYKRRTYSKEFKLDVIQQSYRRDNIRDLADKLGIDPGLIYAWRSKYKTQSQHPFPGKGIPSQRLRVGYSGCRNIKSSNS